MSSGWDQGQSKHPPHAPSSWTNRCRSCSASVGSNNAKRILENLRESRRVVCGMDEYALSVNPLHHRRPCCRSTQNLITSSPPLGLSHQGRYSLPVAECLRVFFEKFLHRICGLRVWQHHYNTLLKGEPPARGSRYFLPDLTTHCFW